MPPSRRGPRTQAGKAAVSRNALKHGITSTTPVIPGMEEEAEWHRHLQGVLASLAPEGYLEELLAGRLANLLWRLNRITRHEVTATMKRIEATALDLAIADNYLAGALSKEGELIEPEPERVREEQHTRVLPPRGDIDLIMRYEAHFHRQWVQTLHELEVLQARRRGERTHLARLDISSPPP